MFFDILIDTLCLTCGECKIIRMLLYAVAVGLGMIGKSVKRGSCNIDFSDAERNAAAEHLRSDPGPAVQYKRNLDSPMDLFEHIKSQLRQPWIIAVRIPNGNGERIDARLFTEGDGILWIRTQDLMGLSLSLVAADDAELRFDRSLMRGGQSNNLLNLLNVLLQRQL